MPKGAASAALTASCPTESWSGFSDRATVRPAYSTEPP